MQNNYSFIENTSSGKMRKIVLSVNIGISLNELNIGVKKHEENEKSSISVKKSISHECYLRGRKAELQQNTQKAINFYNKAIKFNSRNKDAYDRRGVVHMNTLNYAEALRDFVLALRIDNRNVEFLNHLGLVNCALKRYDEALENFSLALRINPQFGKAYFNRALLKLNFDDYQGARKDIIRSVDTDCFGFEEFRITSHMN